MNLKEKYHVHLLLPVQLSTTFTLTSSSFRTSILFRLRIHTHYQLEVLSYKANVRDLLYEIISTFICILQSRGNQYVFYIIHKKYIESHFFFPPFHHQNLFTLFFYHLPPFQFDFQLRRLGSVYF